MPTSSPCSKSAIAPRRTDYARIAGVCCLFVMLAARAISLPLQTSSSSSTSSPSIPALRAPASSSVPASGGVVVAEVTPGSAAEKAGLRAGDVLVSYAARPLATPFAYYAAEQNCLRPAKAALKARRGSRLMEITLSLRESGLTVRPVMSPEILPFYQAGLAEYNAKQWDAAITEWRTAIQKAEATGNRGVCGWLSFQIVGCYQEKAASARLMQNSAETLTWFQRALAYVKDDGDRAGQAEITLYMGGQQINAGKMDAALTYFEQGYALAALDGDEIWMATSLCRQGMILLTRYALGVGSVQKNPAAQANRLAQARRCFSEAAAIFKRLTPDSWFLAESLCLLAQIDQFEGRYASEQALYEQALGIYERSTSQPPEMAGILQQAGIIASIRGDAPAAQRFYSGALKFYSENNAVSLQKRGDLLLNLAIALVMQGDLDQAKQFLQQAAEAYPQNSPGYPTHRISYLMEAGTIAVGQNDLPKARQCFEQALALLPKETAAPQSRANALNLLGWVEVATHRLPEARQRFREALDIWQDEKPPSGMAVNLSALGIGANLNDLGRGVSLNGLGMVAYNSGDMAEAQEKFQQVYDLWRVSATGASQDVSAAANLGRVYLRRKQFDKALPLLTEAISILEARRQNISGLDSRALFMKMYANPFPDLMENYLELHQPGKAFATLERMHARSFADNLAEWRLQLDKNLPPDLKNRQQKLDSDRRDSEEALQRARERKETGGEAAAQAAMENIEKCAAQQRQLDADIRQDYTRRVGHDIAYPQPIDLASAQQCLPKGVLALAYAQDDDCVYLFALTRSSFRVCTLPLSRDALNDRIKKAHNVLSDIHSAPAMSGEVLQGLYRDLLLPVQAEISRARSLLICPDGALNLLPFAALMPDAAHYLIQARPVTLCASLTAYRSLLSNKRPPLTSLLALGDPAYNDPLPSDHAEKSQPTTLGTPWERLPATRRLAREVSQEYAPQSTLLLDKQATVSNFLAKCGQASILFLGCHAVPDDKRPYSSRLVMAPASPGDDGLLPAWQVLHARLNARLVVLWGCETGVGEDNRYEGIQGLPRAFQTAGAENVVMTLWKVQAEETSPILRDFYHTLKADGKNVSLASALQKAQVAAIGRKVNPYTWAAFALNGVGE